MLTCLQDTHISLLLRITLVIYSSSVSSLSWSGGCAGAGASSGNAGCKNGMRLGPDASQSARTHTFTPSRNLASPVLQLACVLDVWRKPKKLKNMSKKAQSRTETLEL